jgi:hypothetical protein
MPVKKETLPTTGVNEIEEEDECELSRRMHKGVEQGVHVA